MTKTLQIDPAIHGGPASRAVARIVADGKFLLAGGDRFLVKGVTYGTFAPDAEGYQLPPLRQVANDFRMMANLGINTVRVYTPPRRDLLDEASRHGLRVMVGLPWSQHVAFLDDRRQMRTTRRELGRIIGELADHPAVLMFALGNEIPAGVARWHGRVRIEHFLRQLYQDGKAKSPDSLFTYGNFPPTEFLDLSFLDVCAFNVYLHREPELRAYVARLQHVAGQKPLLIAEAGADSIREGEAGQADITAMHARVAFEEGACGAVAFAWTDEWWRGGQAVEDWDFGLVDRERRCKPAAAAVSSVFTRVPFPPEAGASWPRVSVVVCAYDAADTLEDCLTSLDRLTYPDFEILLVNDGSRDRTSEIGHVHPRVRVIDTPNRGLSAARNLGLAEATGDIVAYTDADVRVDRDWLTFLVQPLLGSPEFVGSGGPNVVPADDPPMAQCIARAPGGPTHVMLDDRVAEHVPGCNMAFRREALLAIDGFNPIYLRAGDDVDVCWRLQARGWKIGFAPAAVVWHHHRSSVRSYWRQQVGYGEGETWLMAHHPEKFLDGKMLWRGSIYSAVPFVRSLRGTRVNAGVWGTAAFPSVYRADVHPFAFLPHSVRWQVISFALVFAGGGVAATGGHRWAAALLLGGGLVGIAVTFAKNVAYAFRSEVDSVPASRLWARATIACLHFLQPLARARGRIRGMLAPPEVAQPRAEPQTSHGPRPSLAEAWRALLLISGSVTEDRFWSEAWTSADRVLTRLTESLRRSRAVRTVAIDEGWSEDRDVSVFIGRWAWLDVRALVEDHGTGKCLLRVSTHLRPTAFGVTTVLSLGVLLLGATSAGVAYRWPVAGAAAALLTAAISAFTAWRTAQAAAIVGRGTELIARAEGMVTMAPGPARAPLIAPSLLRTYGLRSAMISAVMILALGSGAVLLRDAAIGEVGGMQKGYAGDYGPAKSAWLDTPGGIAIAANGDVYFADSNNALVRHIDAASLVITPVAGNHDLGAGLSGDGDPAIRAQLNAPDGIAIAPDGALIIADSYNHRIRRVDRATGVITTIAGSGKATFDGDGRAAIATALDTPVAVACAPNGDIYVADTMNNRIRMIEHATGLMHTVAGDGRVSEDGPIGDGGPAVAAQLFMPSDVAVAPNGDIYIADMHHNRVRKVDAQTHVISTVAGDGSFGRAGDNGAASRASLAGPAGIALVPETGGGMTIFIADYYNGVIRAIDPDGIMRDVSDDGRVVFGAPSRIAYAPQKHWLYVADATEDRLVALTLPQLPRRAGTARSAPLEGD